MQLKEQYLIETKGFDHRQASAEYNLDVEYCRAHGQQSENNLPSAAVFQL